MIRSILITCLAATVSACGTPAEHTEGFKPAFVSYEANLQSYGLDSDNGPDVKSLRPQRKRARTLWMGLDPSDSNSSRTREASVHELEAFVRTHSETLEGKGQICARGTTIRERGIKFHPIIRVGTDGRARYGTTRDLYCYQSLLVDR